jgi:5-oxoprolinase (ATP-hydrolysing) subunit A
MRIDLNADVGESFGPYTMGDDAALMTSITSANIAAGFHGGDPSVLRATIRLARSHNVSIGAHPGFQDIAGFGRREVRMSSQEAEDLILYQIAAVAGVAAAEGGRLTHVKAHGALYNMAARDPRLAAALARAVWTFDRSLAVFAPARSEMAAAAAERGLAVAREAFADRAYEPDGQLASRQKHEAMILDPDLVVARAVEMVTSHGIVALGGSRLQIDADTICVHGDTPGSDRLAAALRAGFEAAGVAVKAYGQP